MDNNETMQNVPPAAEGTTLASEAPSPAANAGGANDPYGIHAEYASQSFGDTGAPVHSGDQVADGLVDTEEDPIEKQWETDTANIEEFKKLVQGKTPAELVHLLKAGIEATTAVEAKPHPRGIDWIKNLAVRPFEGHDTRGAQEKLLAHSAATQPTKG